MKPLPPRRLDLCAAIVDDYVNVAYHASMQRIVKPGDKRCERKGKVAVGYLTFCTVHARLAREGFVAASGRVTDRGTIRDYRALWAAGQRVAPPNTWAEGDK